VLLREWVQDKRQERVHGARAAAKEKTRAKAVIQREPPPVRFDPSQRIAVPA
jgi:cell division protein FtsQ